MKNIILKYFLFSFPAVIITACSVGNYLSEETVSDQQKLTTVIDAYRDSAYTEVDYYDMKDYYEEYIGAYFELEGYVIDEVNENFLFYADPYYGENYGFFNIVIDHPLPKQSEVGKPLRYLTVGDHVILLAKMKGLESYSLEKKTIQVPIQNYFLSLSGDEFIDIPLLEGIVIQKKEENDIPKQPEWLSNMLLNTYLAE